MNKNNHLQEAMRMRVWSWLASKVGWAGKPSNDRCRKEVGLPGLSPTYALLKRLGVSVVCGLMGLGVGVPLTAASVIFSSPAVASGGECRWEGGAGYPTYASCLAEDCLEDNGQAICTEPEIVVPWNLTDAHADSEKFVYSMCAMIPNYGQGGGGTNLVRWCQAQGGTFVTNGNYYACENLPAEYIGGPGAASNEQAAVTASDNFAGQSISENCPSYSKTDSGWGFVGSGDNLCWNTAGPLVQNGFLLRDTRQQNYTFNSCGSQYGIKIGKTRELRCPASYGARNTQNGDLQCVIPVPCCEVSGRAGNPVETSTGAKIHQETDYQAADGLQFSRYYHSINRYRPISNEPFYATDTDYWRTSYSRHIYAIQNNTNVMAVVQRDDSSLLPFNTTGDQMLNQSGGAARLSNLGSDGWELTLANSDVERYNSQGQLLSITARSGVVTTMTYDSLGRLWQIVNSFGKTLTLSYNADGNIQSVTTPDNSQIQYTYDRGRLVTVRQADLSSRTYHYEHANQWLLTGITDENNVRFATYTYDSSGLMQSEYHAGGVNSYQFSMYRFMYQPAVQMTVTDPLGQARNYVTVRVGGVFKVRDINVYCPGCPSLSNSTFDSNGNYSTTWDLNGNQTVYSYDLSRNLEISRTEASGTTNARTISTEWHATYRLPLLVTEPGRSTAYSYDAKGNLLSKTVTDTATSEARTWSYTYNNYSQVLTANGPRTDVSDITTYTYYTCTTGAECGQVHTVTNALGQVTTFATYNAAGLPLSVIDTNGVTATLTYDARQRLLTRSVAGETTSFAYWPTGLLKQVTLPDASTMTYNYDAAHRLTSVVDSEGNSLLYTLDAAGNRTQEKALDATGNVVRTHSRVFDSLSRLAQELGAASQSTSYAYDNNGNLLSVTDPSNRATTYGYDALNRLVSQLDPASQSTSYGYDSQDNLVSVTDPKSLTTTYTYNGLGDLKQLASPDTGVTTYTPDAAGNIAQQVDARTQSGTYSYDALGRVTQIQYADQVQDFVYDQGVNGKGRLTALTDASGSTQYRYDAQGRVLSKQQTVDTQTKTVQYAYTNGNLSQLITPSGQAITYGYTQGKLTGITVNGTPLLNNVVYQPFGPTEGWSWGNGTLTVRQYNADGQLTTIDSAGLTTYSYHPDGTIATQTHDTSANLNLPTGATNFTVSATSNRIDGSTGTLARTYSYDAAGNTLSDGLRSFTYNGAGRMATATNGSITTTYSYNALGQRVKKSNSNGTTYFVYDEQGHLLGEYDPSGNLIQELVWLNDIPVATLRTDQGGSGVGVFYTHTDHLNSPTKITRPNDNQIIWRWDHDPYGNGAPSEDPDGNGLTLDMNLRFPGQYYDGETGLNYNYFRDYDPVTGRYTQSDPIGLFGGINTYTYVRGNPLNFVDPEGLDGFIPNRCAPGFHNEWDVRSGWTCIPNPQRQERYCPNGDCAAFPAEMNCACVNDCLKEGSGAKLICKIIRFPGSGVARKFCQIATDIGVCTSKCQGKCDLTCKK